MIIGVHGKKRSGKDTCADYLGEQYGFQKIAFADEVRAALYILDPIISSDWRYADAIDNFGYERAKDLFPEIRKLLQRLGTEVGREMFDPDLWVKLLLPKLEGNVNYVISDIRFENEAKMVRNMDGPVLHIIRNTGLGDTHISEEPLPDEFITHHIYNSSTLHDLYETLDFIVRKHL